MIVGVLALQGGFEKHISMLRSIDVDAVEVKTPEQLDLCRGLIIPGGESTAIIRRMDFIGFIEPLRQFAKKKPILGTCAGLILMSKNISFDHVRSLGILDVDVERNAYGRQTDSFTTTIELAGGEIPFPAVFIRAPRITRCGNEVQVLASLNGEPVFVQEGKHLGLTFHPELSEDSTIHRYFVENCCSIPWENLNG